MEVVDFILSFKEISSSGNPNYKEYRRLAGSRRYRRRKGKLALEGPRLVAEALAVGLHPQAVFVTRSFLERGERVCSALPAKTGRYLLPPALFSRMVHTETPQGIAAIFPFKEPDYSSVAAGDLSLALIADGLQDPGNMGTAIRTAAAAGLDAFFYGPGCVDPYGPKALRSSAGSLFHLPPTAAADPSALLQSLKQGGVSVVAARPGAERSFWEFDYRQKTALLIGSESRGLSPELVAAADTSVCIPQFSPLDSLNAAVAAAVIIYEALRQRTR